MPTWRSTFALLTLRFQLLATNRSACVVLVLLPLAGMIMSQRAAAPTDSTCYLVYWQEDAWVEHLRSELEFDQDAPVELAHVSRFTDRSGLISYPPGTHSIQLRPPNATSSHWTIWYWHSGHDPSVIQPAVAWFWKTSREYWQGPLPLEVRSSSLNPMHPLARMVTDATIGKLWSRMQSGALILLAALFFSTAYLQTTHLSEDLHHRALDTIFTKPVDRWHWATTTAAFHGLIAAAVVLPLITCFGWSQHPAVYLTCALLAFGFTGLSFAVGCNTASVRSAGSTLMLYCILATAIATFSSTSTVFQDGILSAEWSFVTLASRPTEVAPFHWLTLCTWTLGWIIFGCVSYRRWIHR